MSDAPTDAEAPPPTPGGGFAPLEAVTAGLNAVGTVLIIALMVLVNADVIGRNLLRAPVPGVVELTEAAIVIIVFLQVGHTLRVGKFTRSDGLFGLLERRAPTVASSLEAAYAATGAALFALIAVNAVGRTAEAVEGDYFAGVPGAFTLPTWPVELAIAVGSAVMTAQFIAICVARARRVAAARQGGAS